MYKQFSRFFIVHICIFKPESVKWLFIFLIYLTFSYNFLYINDSDEQRPVFFMYAFNKKMLFCCLARNDFKNLHL